MSKCPAYQLHRITNPAGSVVEVNCTRQAALRFSRFGPVLVAAFDGNGTTWLPVQR